MVDNNEVVIKKQWFIGSSNKKIDSVYSYNPKKALGAGTYGSVFKAEKKDKGGSGQTAVKRAIKIIQKSKVKNEQRFRTEIEIMIKLDHPNVIKLYETYEDSKNIYLVMEMCEGGELFDRIIDKGQFTEKEARDVFTQIMQALHYCHTNKICHRDLKPENFLMVNKNVKENQIKIIDFGLSTYIGDESANNKMNMTTKAGTPYYISPEVLAGKYDESCDIWSSGVILYILLSGVPPFFGETDPEILSMVKAGVFSFNIPQFDKVSDGPKDLIRKMITKPEQRLTTGQVLNHPWMVAEKVQDTNLALNFSTLKTFQNQTQFKKVILTFIASQLSETEITELGKLFKKLDKNNDGTLSIEEILKALEAKDQNIKDEVTKAMKSIDTDGSGNIAYTEFIAATLEKSVYLKEEKLWSAFKAFDTDNSQTITADELKKILGQDSQLKKYDDSYWNDMIKEADKNGDGVIDYAEFIDMMSKTNN